MSTMLDSQWLTVREAAEMLGVTDVRVRQFLLEARLKGSKFGHSWAIPRAECERFAQEERPTGNPNFRKPESEDETG